MIWKMWTKLYILNSQTEGRFERPLQIKVGILTQPTNFNSLREQTTHLTPSAETGGTSIV
jgi:hypothetical protein